VIERARAAAAPVALVVAAAFLPIPWHLAAWLSACALGATLQRGRLWSAMGLAMGWSAVATRLGEGDERWSWGLGAAVWLAAGPGWRLGLGVGAVFAALAAKQVVAGAAFPAALLVISSVCAQGVAAAGGAAAARGGRAEGLALALAAACVLGRTALVWREDGLARVEAARRVGALGLVYDGLLAESPDVLAALVAGVPDRDEAALALGWYAALEQGWRPQRAEGVVVDVARELDRRGRGGEALRLLYRHPRAGEVDGLAGILERSLGLPSGWRGGVVGAPLPRPMPGPFPVGSYRVVEFTLPAPAVVWLEGEGVVNAHCDADPDREDWLPARWTLDAGPHRLEVHAPHEAAVVTRLRAE
jgi:hypothetical protein